jgi:hypothetical protein
MTRTSSFPSNRERGMIGFAVLLLAGVVIMIFTMSFFVSWATFQSSLAFDSYHSQQTEMAGLQQVVQESILALRSTEPTYNPNNLNYDIAPEISKRLGGLTFTPGVSISLTKATTPPAHIFYPFGSAATASALPMFSSSTVQPGIAGTGNRALTFLTRGPAADLGTDPAGTAPYTYSTYTFSRSVTINNNPTAESRVITVTARLFSVPVTNIDCIAYGLPSTGSVAPSSPMMPNGFFANGISRLVTTLNDPTKDPTFYPDLYDPNNPNSLGYQYENSVLFSWDAYEFIWGNTYQDALLSAAGPTGTFDFDAPANPPIAGVTSSGNSVTIDLSSVTATTLAVVDASGTGRSIQIHGSPTGNSLNASPLLLYFKNTGSGPTNVDISGDNNRPTILFSRQCALIFSGNPQFQGAIILDRNSTAAGSATLFGHLSFYCGANPFPAWSLTLADSPSVKTALAALAPRVLLVSTSATR